MKYNPQTKYCGFGWAFKKLILSLRNVSSRTICLQLVSYSADNTSKTEKEKSLKSILTDVTKTAIGLEVPLKYSWKRKGKKGGEN